MARAPSANESPRSTGSCVTTCGLGMGAGLVGLFKKEKTVPKCNRGVNKGLYVLLSRTQAGPGRTVKQEQEEISRNHLQTFISPSVHNRYGYRVRLQSLGNVLFLQKVVMAYSQYGAERKTTAIQCQEMYMV